MVHQLVRGTTVVGGQLGTGTEQQQSCLCPGRSIVMRCCPRLCSLWLIQWQQGLLHSRSRRGAASACTWHVSCAVAVVSTCLLMLLRRAGRGWW